MQYRIKMLHQNSQFSELLKIAREGDLLAFEQIMRQWERKIFGYVFRMVTNREDAQDLTQEIFVKVYKNIATARADGFSAWLYTIATHTVYDFLRKKRGKLELLLINDPERPFETFDPFDAYIEVEERLDVEQALQKIQPAYRSALLLFYKDELSLQQVADVLRVPINTVKTHLRRARMALKEHL